MIPEEFSTGPSRRGRARKKRGDPDGRDIRELGYEQIEQLKEFFQAYDSVEIDSVDGEENRPSIMMEIGQNSIEFESNFPNGLKLTTCIET